MQTQNIKYFNCPSTCLCTTTLMCSTSLVKIFHLFFVCHISDQTFFHLSPEMKHIDRPLSFFRGTSVRLNWICRRDVAWRLHVNPGDWFQTEALPIPWTLLIGLLLPHDGGGWRNMRPFHGLSTVKLPAKRKAVSLNEQAFNGDPQSKRADWEVGQRSGGQMKQKQRESMINTKKTCNFFFYWLDNLSYGIWQHLFYSFIRTLPE